MLRRMFASGREKVTQSWIQLHNEEFHNFYFSPNIVMVIKLRMILARYVARVGETIDVYTWETMT
jgi:hypothetical protein